MKKDIHKENAYDFLDKNYKYLESLGWGSVKNNIFFNQ